MSETKTGNKGFVNPVDGKVYTIDPVPAGEDGVNLPQNLKTYDPGNIKVDQTVKDIGNKTRITLGTYLSKATKGEVGSSTVRNKYVIDESTDNTPVLSLTTQGYPTGLTPSSSGNSEKFASELPNSFSENFQEFFGQFKKGKQNSQVIDGNDLLGKNITTDSTGFTKINDPGLRNYFEKVMLNNFFHPDISNSVLSKDTNPKSFLIKEIDASSPPSTFEPSINIGLTSGKYSGQESIKTPWSLIDLRKKASDISQANQYSVSPPEAGPFDDLLQIVDPATSLPVPLSNRNEDSYVDREQIKPLSRDPSIQNFSKGKESTNEVNGNELLKDVPGGSIGILPGNPLYDYVGGRGATVLNVGNNRWTNSSRPGAGFNPGLKLADGTAVSHLKLAQVGTGLLQRAAAEIPAWISSPDSKFNPNGLGASAGAILPSVAQLGILKVNNVLLEAQDVLDSLSGVSTTGRIEDEDNRLAEDALISIAPFDGQSWGTLTTPDELFDDSSNIGFTITMFLLVIAISLLFGLFENSKGVPTEKTDPNGRLALGKFKFGQTPSRFGFISTDNDFLKCLGVGAKAFFIGASNARISDGQVALAALGIGVDSLIGQGSAVGANLTVARTIIRSGLVIAQYIERITKAASNNPVAAISALAGITKLLSTSKLFAALNVFAQLGDALLSRQFVDIAGPDGAPLPGTGIDAQSPQIGHSTVRKNRLSYYENKKDDKGNLVEVLNYNSELAWASKRAPSSYLIPGKIAGLQEYSNNLPDSALSAFAGALKLSQPNNEDKKFASTKTYNSVVDRRLPNELRVQLENVLEAEYVPFYFHDIRTNEIISFHAFLTSLSDDYSVSYDTVEGFGRVEPVKIYKGTQRKIGFSFTIASTSEDDFQHMWFKINKLVTLAYPQYTAGRGLVGKDFEFKAPFSQMIGASPLIRLRLGDLFHSNYSRFGLARLFGVVDGDFKTPDLAATTKALTTNEKATKSKRDGIKSEFYYTKPYKKEDADGSKTQKYEKKKVTSKYVPDAYANSYSVSDIKEATIVGRDKEKPGYYLVEFEFFEKSDTTKPGEPRKTLKTAETVVQSTWLTLTEDAIDVLLKDQGVETGGPAKANIHNGITAFMDPATNVIVRSFESAGGKGLAGVIESMNFDWYNQTTWEVIPGYVAPKMCKVTISFSPIHDITPGIDHEGYNRAPIYPVGSAMNGKGAG